MENSQFEVLQDAADKLTSISVDYMVTGSMAGSIYTIPRMTRDIDIVVKIFHANKNKIIEAFQKDYGVSEEDINFALQHNLMFNFLHNKKQAKIDFIVQKRTPYRLKEFERRKYIESNLFKGYVVSLEDLIISKVEWAKDSLSELQGYDIKSLLRTGKSIDKEYLEHWLNELNLTEIFNKLTHE